MLTPLLKGVTGPDSGYDLMTLDVDQYPELAAEYKVSLPASLKPGDELKRNQVSALPTVVAFKNGKVANKFGEHQHGLFLLCTTDWYQSGSDQKRRSRSSLDCYRRNILEWIHRRSYYQYPDSRTDSSLPLSVPKEEDPLCACRQADRPLANAAFYFPAHQFESLSRR